MDVFSRMTDSQNTGDRFPKQGEQFRVTDSHWIFLRDKVNVLNGNILTGDRPPKQGDQLSYARVT